MSHNIYNFSLLDAEGYPECVISDFLSFSVILGKDLLVESSFASVDTASKTS